VNVKPFNTLVPISQWVDTYTFLVKTGHAGIMLQLKGINRDCINGAMAEAFTARVRQALKGFSDDYRIYEFVIKNGDAEIPVSDHAINNLAREAALKRKRFLESNDLYKSGIFYCFLYKPKPLNYTPRPRGGLSISLKLKSHLKILARELERNRRTVFHRARSFVTEIGDLLQPRILPKDEACLLWRILTNLDPKLAAAVPVTGTTDVDQCLGSTHLNLNPDGISTNYRYVRVLSMKETPKVSGPNMFADLCRIKANFILCMQYEPYTAAQSIKEIGYASHHFHYAQWMQSLGNLFTMLCNKFTGKSETDKILADESATANLEEINQLAKALNDDDVLGELVFTLVLHDTDEGKLDLAAAEAIRAMGQYGASMFLETYNGRDAYLGILPGNKEYTLDRTYLVLRSTFADMSFIYRLSNGEQRNSYLGSEYLFAAENSDSEPYYVTTNYNDVNNLFMCGLMGSGKSVLCNKLLEGNIKNGARVLVLDEGHGYRELNDKYGGSYCDFDFDKQNFFINPFILRGTLKNRLFLTTLIRLLLKNVGYQPTLDDNRSIWDGVNELYEKGEWHERRLRNVTMRREARLALSSWIQDGEHAWLFDNIDDSLSFSEFQVFEFSGAEDEELSLFLEPLLFYIFKRWEQTIQDPELLGVEKILLMDEAWRHLMNPTVQKKISSLVKRVRKHNGGVYCVCQFPKDIVSVGMQNFNEMFPTKMSLSNPNASIESDAAAGIIGFKQLFGWNDAEVEAFRRLAPKRDVMIKKGERPAEIFQVNLAPEDLAMVGNDPIGNIRRKEAKRNRDLQLVEGEV
jgi:type IV secretion system protein TrbE